MAELVLGVGSSHSPMVTLDGDGWLEWGQRDHPHPMLHTRAGRHVGYDEQLAIAGDSLADQASIERCRAGAERTQAAVAALGAAIAGAALDVLIVVGDDQDEHLLADNLPPFLVYWGDTITNRGMSTVGDVSGLARRYLTGYREPGDDRTYPVATGLARHLIGEAIASDFDVATSQRLPQPGKGMGHAFGFPLRRLVSGAGDQVALLPVMVNTYNPPSQPRASRCAAFGAMLRRSIESYDGDDRVGIVASGGLSHFLVLEDLDREVLDAFARRDLAAVTSLPESTFVAGTSEIKNWIAVAAACADRRFELVDYVPGYRTPAGTGVGLAFALWR
jgi:3-O-methylgallate 3,4-dioxygenase